jgi:hypothetical protein
MGPIILLIALYAAAFWAAERNRRWGRENPGKCHACGKPTGHHLCDECHDGTAI